MTRYDPFSYGQVRLGGKQAPAAESPDDLLFADAGPKKQAPPAADSSWSLLEESVDGLLPGAQQDAGAIEFGTEILGETAAPAAAPAPAPASSRPRAAQGQQPPPRAPRADAGDGRPAAAGRPVRGDAPKEVRAKVSAPAVAAASKPATTAAAAAPVAPREALPLPRRRHRPLAGVLVPFVLCAGGGMAAAWLAITQQNPVMAAIVGSLTLVGSAFAWLSLRP